MTSSIVTVIVESSCSKTTQSGDVRCICGVRRAQCPTSVSLQLPIQVIASLLLFRPVPQLPEVHLVHSQVQATVHLWTQEERLQNTLQNTLAPGCGRKPRMERQLNTGTLHQTLHFDRLRTNVFRGTLHKYFKEHSFYYQILPNTKKIKIKIKKPTATWKIHHSQLGKASTK